VELFMEIRRLGATGLSVSRLGLGLAALGRPGYINIGHAADIGSDRAIDTLESRAHTVLDAAWANGIRYFDAARSYGCAEAFLASWLASRKIPPGQVTIGSKWGYTYTANWAVTAEKHEVKDHSLTTLRRQSRESTELLGPYLNLYQIHSATLESGVLDNRDVLNELSALRGSGLKIGLSSSGPNQGEVLHRALNVTVDGRRLFDCIQATWNLLESSAGATLKEAHDAGVGVIVKEALANGRLTERNTEPSFMRKHEVLAREASRLSTRMDALGLAAVLAQPWADVVLSGAATVEQLKSNLEANTVQWDSEASMNLGQLAETPSVYWAARAGLAWN
jgi:aryl-alcohol dehydrogenase-like predicted oxidoreductase